MSRGSRKLLWQPVPGPSRVLTALGLKYQKSGCRSIASALLFMLWTSRAVETIASIGSVVLPSCMVLTRHKAWGWLGCPTDVCLILELMCALPKCWVHPGTEIIVWQFSNNQSCHRVTFNKICVSSWSFDRISHYLPGLECSFNWVDIHQLWGQSALWSEWFFGLSPSIVKAKEGHCTRIRSDERSSKMASEPKHSSVEQWRSWSIARPVTVGSRQHNTARASFLCWYSRVIPHMKGLGLS